MSNMSYCRFENTLSDLKDCYEEMVFVREELSESEKRAKVKLITLCNDIAIEFTKDEE